jgi:MSHA pilin protein MshC
MSLNPNQVEAIKQGTGQCSSCGAQVWLFGLRVGDKQRGFTLVELVMTMVIVGIIAAVAVPRFFDANVFKSRGFADQVQASLRYAQKEAIAQRRNVCVATTASDITLTIASVSGAASACNTNLASPAGQPSNCPSATYKICTPSAAIALALLPAAPATFVFDALGKPFDTAGVTPSAQKTITIIGATNNIVVEAETGYVHSP